MQGLEQRLSIKSILSKVNRDFKPSRQGWQADAIEWIYEGLAEIGTNINCINKTSDFEVTNHRLKVPCDLIQHHKVMLGCNELLNINIGKLRDIEHSTLQSRNNYYYVEGGYFKFNFELGIVRIIYDGIDVDCDGFPTIPDSVEFLIALSWLVLYHLQLQGNNFPNIDIQTSYGMWNQYKNKAKNIAHMPSPVEMDKIMYYFANNNLNYEMLTM